MTSYVSRYRRHYDLRGHLWQGRFKPFAIQDDDHLLTVIRYVERNPIRAYLVNSATAWAWSSLGSPPPEVRTPALYASPVARCQLAGPRGATSDRGGTGRGAALRRTRNSFWHACVDQDGRKRTWAGVHAAAGGSPRHAEPIGISQHARPCRLTCPRNQECPILLVLLMDRACCHPYTLGAVAGPPPPPGTLRGRSARRSSSRYESIPIAVVLRGERTAHHRQQGNSPMRRLSALSVVVLLAFSLPAAGQISPSKESLSGLYPGKAYSPYAQRRLHHKLRSEQYFLQIVIIKGSQ